jgi:hypothetical protein
VDVDGRLGGEWRANMERLPYTAWSKSPANLQRIQDTLKWGSMSVIRSAVRHSEAFPEFRSHQRTCVGDQNDGGKALSYDVPQT